MYTASDNPFRAQRFHALAYRAHDTDADALLQRLWAQGGRGALVGAHGHGKTTLLKALNGRLEKTGHECVWLGLNQDQRNVRESFFTSLNAKSVILFDGAEQLGAWAWWKFLKRTRHVKGLVVTTHRAGRLPTLYECRTSEALMEQLLKELAPEAGEELKAQARDLFVAHNGNLREVWFGLYEVLSTDLIDKHS